jgi:hypothetical protein
VARVPVLTCHNRAIRPMILVGHSRGQRS